MALAVAEEQIVLELLGLVGQEDAKVQTPDKRLSLAASFEMVPQAGREALGSSTDEEEGTYQVGDLEDPTAFGNLRGFRRSQGVPY
jgi:hypothetical protein